VSVQSILNSFEPAMSSKIVQIELRHLPAVALVHARAFPDSALTRLGLEALRRYYEWQLGLHEHHSIGVFDKADLLGFAVGGRQCGALEGLGGFVQKNRWYLVGRIMLKPRLVFSERGRKAMISALKVLRRLRVKSTPVLKPAETRPSFGVLAIAVNPALQGSGLGLQLMECLEQIARRNNFTHMHLTVSVKNARAIRFYEKLGWTRCSSEPVWTGEMVKTLS